MADKTIFQPEEIVDQPFPNDVTETGIQEQGNTQTVFTPPVTPPRTFPQPVVAQHTIGDSIDTQSRRIKGTFQLDRSGGIQIGQYQIGVSGEIDITSNGLVAKNKNGQETVTIDGDTGDATFLGTLQAGTLIAGDSNVVIDKDPDTGGGREVITDPSTGKKTILIGYQKGGF